jgi:uncharacterized protein YbbC (DUF1343 family)
VIKVQTGLESFLESPSSYIKGSRIALLANQASINSEYEHIVDLLDNVDSCNLIRIFAPEHGFRGEMQDMDAIDDAVDADTGIPIRSLYGDSKDTLVPKQADLEDIDTLIVDLPDIGSRYYTFAQTMIYSMEVAAKSDTKVLVLDRPNPINGTTIEGGPLDVSCRSFCGHLDTPNRHGLTLGELAQMAQAGFGLGQNATQQIDCDLEVVPCTGWKRSEYLDSSNLPWVYPSPNMPTIETAVIYPGSCLFEATELSEGRGTTRPLEQFGAPFVNGKQWAKACLEEKITLQGAILRPISFVPKFQKHANTVCAGLQIHVVDRSSFQPLRWCLALIAAAYRLYPSDFAWRKQAFEFEDRVPAIDLLFGSSVFRKTLERGDSLEGISEILSHNEKEFENHRQAFLLY